MRGSFLLVVVAVMAVVSGSEAWAFRCGGRIVSLGATKFEVLNLCGEPDYQETIRIDDFGYKITKTDQWSYNCGESNFIHVLTFREGVLLEVETGSRGWGVGDCY